MLVVENSVLGVVALALSFGEAEPLVNFEKLAQQMVSLKTGGVAAGAGVAID